MCGIAGILRFDGIPVEYADIKMMTDAIAHRGPDGEGQWCEGPVGLGHRRLAIIDLSLNASQPMSSLDERYVIAYNGEVYNFRELRRELEKSGSHFRSHSDTEVVLEAVIRWGIDQAIRRFNGMFAFAIWDRETRTLLIGRDRYGIKPLYIWASKNGIAFASEPKAFRALPYFSPALDAHGVAEYFTFQNILTDRTFLKDVRVFPAGYWGRFVARDTEKTLEEFQYWDFKFEEPDDRESEAEYVEELQRLLSRAVDRQLVSDVEVGSYLSGGLDSGSIVALAAKQLPGMKTFTIGFELDEVAENERHFDERAAARLIAAAAGTNHLEMIIGPEDVRACLPEIGHHIEEPRVGQSYPNYYAAKLASQHVKVVLAGTGGDEILGGYPWRYPNAELKGHDFVDWHFGVWNRLLTAKEMDRFLAPLRRRLGNSDMRVVHATLLRSKPEPEPFSELHEALYFEAKTFLPGLLAVEDRLSMAHGIETRVPFLDNDLVDFCQRLPRSMRLTDLSVSEGSIPSVQQRRMGKVILRRLGEHLLPPQVSVGEKQGFSGPDTAWFVDSLEPAVLQAIDQLKTSIFDAAIPEMELRDALLSESRTRSLSWSFLAASSYLSSLD